MRVINDLHLGSTYELLGYDEVLSLAKDPTPTVWLGDIVDLRNCKKSEVELWLSNLRVLSGTAQAKGHTWIRGNHELNQLPGKDWAIVDGVYYTHGDLGLLWPKAKGEEFRSRTPGASWFKRHIISPLINEARELVDAKIDQRCLDEMVRIADTYDIHTIIAGHRHPQQTIDGSYKGVKYKVLKRGINEV